MFLTRVVPIGLALLGAASASSCMGPTNPTGPTQQSVGAIAYGTADTAHTAVVSLLASAGGGSFTECSGTIVQVQNGQGYVLTAAHCCNNTVPSLVVVSNDYSVGENYLFGGTPAAPVYEVTAGSVYYDAMYNQQDHDFCMLQFAAPAGTATIPVATGTDGLALGVSVEHVGFGTTDTSTNNSGRRTGTEVVNVDVNALTITWSQGGSTHTPGTCEGDSGGPALLTAGATPSQQHVVAVTSFGNATTCTAITQGTASRVTSETGPGGFISSYLAGTPIGTMAGGATTDCQTCANNAQTGACSSQATACGNDQACITLDDCLNNCNAGDTTCENGCVTTAGQTAANELNAYDNCVCSTACTSQCATECGGTAPTDGGVAPTDGGTGDPCTTCSGAAQDTSGACAADVQTCMNDAACGTLVGCINGCAAGDQTCVQTCATTAGATATNEVNDILTCICTTCASQCASSCATGMADAGMMMMMGQDGGIVIGQDAGGAHSDASTGTHPDGSTSAGGDGGTSNNGEAGTNHAGDGGTTGGNPPGCACVVAGAPTGSSSSSSAFALAFVGIALAIASGRRRRSAASSA